MAKTLTPPGTVALSAMPMSETVPQPGIPPATSFAHVPFTAAGHFLLYYYAAVHRLLDHIRRLARHGGDDLDLTFRKYPFLTHYGNEILAHMPEGKSWDDGPGWWEQTIADWQAAQQRSVMAQAPRLPLLALAREADISFRSRVALILVGLVEEDSRFGTVLADLQAPLPYRRPTLEFVAHAMIDDPGDGHPGSADASAVCRELLSSALVEVVNRESPRSEWALRVPSILWDAIRGHSTAEIAPHWQLHEAGEYPAMTQLIAPPEFLEQLSRLPAVFAAGRATAVILRGMPGSDRLRTLGSVARAMGRGIIEVALPPAREAKDANDYHRSLDQLGPLCLLTGAMPVLRFDLPPGETAAIPALTAYRGPVGIILGLEGGLTGRPIERSVTLTAPMPDASLRLRLWQAALGEDQTEDLEQISERFHIPGGYITEAAVLASAHSALDGRTTVTSDDVRQACRTLDRQTLDTLATRLDCHGTWNDLVLSGNAAEKLKELDLRCRYRERLLSHVGPAFGPPANGNRGVRALLSGPSGTGKTLAARILAAELGKDLYRVDLAAVINKYIGETEKNLHRVLSIAESHDIVLLLDEGDSVMGSRTDIKNSNDRYANLETNYLLQRLESYQGIVLVTTNLGDNIDQAFQRRMDVVVNFLPPGVQERLRIWERHLPERHTIPDGFLREVAIRCALTGGQIRNAVQHAAIAALSGREPGLSTQNHLAEAIFSEYRKMGAICPLAEGQHDTSPARPGRRGGIQSFIAAVT
jgi:hypothetical protein